MRFLTLAILVASKAALATPCGTPARLAKLGVPHKLPVKQLRAGATKLVRDGFPGPHQARTSANFAVQWRDAAVTDAQAQQILDAAEQGFSLYTGAFAQTPPSGSDAYLINIYVSASAQDSPSIDFDGGYAWSDDEGYPYVVLSAALLTDGPNLVDTTVHELYHDFQITAGAFATQYWYWEATAEWAAQELLPESNVAYVFIGAYALAEELPIFYWSDPLAGDPVVGVHQYGAASLPNYLTSSMQDRSLVPATWRTGAAADDPLDALFAQVAGTKDEIDDLFIAFAAHQVLYDVPHADVIQPWVAAYAHAYPERSRFDAHVAAAGAPDWTAPTVLPRAFGFDIVELARPVDGKLHVELATDASGSTGTPARWRAMLVQRTTTGIRYTPVAAVVDAELGLAEDKAWLVVASTADTRSYDETFGFRYRVNPPPDPEPDPDPTTTPYDPGCSTGGPPGPAGGAIGLVLAALVLRRRDSARHRRSSHRTDR
jgi:uncharacterized protein (TIGR03382 family)